MKIFCLTLMLLSCLSLTGKETVMQKSDSLGFVPSNKSSALFYDSLAIKASRHKVTRWLYGTMICSAGDSGVSKDLQSYEYYKGYRNSTIASVSIRSLKVFGPTFDDTARTTQIWIEKAANTLHSSSNLYVIQKNLWFKDGQSLYPDLMMDNERLLRSLPYLKDVRIIITPRTLSPNLVDVLVLTQDVFSFGITGGIGSINKGEVGVYDKNILGVGHEIGTTIVGHADMKPHIGFETYYSVNNIMGRFINFSAGYANTYLREGFFVSLDRDFLRPQSVYAGGLSVFRSFRSDRIGLSDRVISETLLNYLYLDGWYGRRLKLGVNPNDSRFQMTLAGRIRYSHFYERPLPDTNSKQYFANSTAGTPDDLIPILQRLRNSPNLTLAQIDAIRSDLGNIAGRAIQSGDRRLSSVASQMADDIGSYIDESAATGQGFSPEQAAAYQEARTLRRQQGDTFERGAVGATLKRGQFGEQSPASTVPADLFFRGGGSPEAAQQFIAAAGGRPRALQAAQNYLSTMLRQNVMAADGTIDAARLARFQNDYSGALHAFPELRAGIQNVADAQAIVDQATLTQTARQAEMAGSPLNQFLTKNPTEAVSTILKSQNSQAAVGRIMEQLRDNPASLAAFKRSVVEWFRGSIENAGVQPVSGEPLQSFAKLKSIMDNKLPTLRQIFTPAEIDVMQAFADQMGQEARVMGSKPLGSNTFANLASRYLVDRATNSIAPMTGKNVSSMTPGLSWLLRGTDVSIRDAINNALLNPSAASRMVEAASKIPTNSPVMALVALKRGLTGQLGIQAINSGQQNINLPSQIMEFLDRLQNPIPPKEQLNGR